MYRGVWKLFLYLLCIKTKDASARETQKFVHQRDMSEQCRRRVVPSVFLGQHVTDANSQTMQFSQLELPYSCSLSVRAEAGNNIILFIHLLSEDSLIEACDVSGDQLIVYELGETFGGYWGPVPNVFMKGIVKNYTQYYTLKTTSPPTTRKPKTTTTEKKILKYTETQSTVKEQEYYTMDVPIVDVSGNFQLGPRRDTNDSEDLFNYIYDVTPRNGVEYETSIMPIVQFSIRQANGYDGELRYELDYDTNGVTMDPRLIFNTAKKKKTFYRKDWRDRRFRHRTKRPAMFKRRESKKLYTLQPGYINEVKSAIPTLDVNYFTKSWELVDDIIKSINTTTVRSTIFENKTFLNIIDNISNSRHNFSVYLTPNISVYNVDMSTKDNETIFEDVTDSNPSVDNSKLVEINSHGIPASTSTTSLHTSEEKSSQVTLDLSHLKSEYDLRSKNDKTEEDITDIHERTSLDEIETEEIMTTDQLNDKNELLTEITTEPSTSMDNSIKTSLLTGAMVDHESWENIVQAAPVMAVVLNNTEPLMNNTINKVSNKRKHKRYVQSLEIEQSRPRNLTTKRLLVSDEKLFGDIHDMARLVELEDDEMGSRVALRYLRHYVGSPMFNLCEHRDQSLRQMFLFNSSRIVIAVSNFTLDRVMLVLTPAQTLPSGGSTCPKGQLECQIVGTRVCIDSLNACDGVPNCGSYEIYDEDRLTCGTAQGVHRSVYLAALTFLAVIITTAYIILYWLERCVPRVSDAFFVYSDSSENELLLESVMRSPNDEEDPTYKMSNLGHFFEDDVLYHDLNAGKKVNFCQKICRACRNLLGFRKIPTENPSENIIAENQKQKKELSRMFSFTQLELKKFGKIEFKDKGVQTVDSFEIQEFNLQQDKEENTLSSLTNFKSRAYQHDTRRPTSELNLLKFSKESRLSSQSNSISYEYPNTTMKRHAVCTGTDGELEIENILYEHVLTPRSTIPTCEVHTETKPNESSKRLRFDEELKMISAIEEDDDDWPTSSTMTRLNNDETDKIGQVHERESSIKDFRRFFGAKGKKSKKMKSKHVS